MAHNIFSVHRVVVQSPGNSEGNVEPQGYCVLNDSSNRVIASTVRINRGRSVGLSVKDSSGSTPVEAVENSFNSSELSSNDVEELKRQLREHGTPKSAFKQVKELSLIYNNTFNRNWGIDPETSEGSSDWSTCLSQVRTQADHRLTPFQLTILSIGLGFGPVPALDATSESILWRSYKKRKDQIKGELNPEEAYLVYLQAAVDIPNPWAQFQLQDNVQIPELTVHASK